MPMLTGRTSSHLPPRSRPTSPAEELVLTGAIRRDPKYLVSYVDIDDDGNLRLIQYVPTEPRRAA